MSAVPDPEARRRLVEGLALATGAMAATTFGTLSFPAIAPFVRDSFGLSTAEVGMFTALVFGGAMIASIPAGRLTDRLGAPVMLALAQGGVATGVLIAAIAPTRLLFFAGIGVSGLAYGAVNPASNVLANDVVPGGRRALMLSMKQTGVPIGALIGSATLPIIAETVGWRTSLMLPVAALMIGMVFSLTLVRREAARLASVDASDWDGVGAVAGPSPSLAPMSLYGFIMAGIQLSFVGYLTVYLVDEQGFAPASAGFALALAMAAGVSGRIIWGAVSDRFFNSHATSLMLAGLGSCAGLLLLLAGGGSALWPAIVLIGLCGIGWNGVYLALVADRSTLGTFGRATGLALIFLYAGIVVLPPSFGLLVEAIESWPATWLTASGLALCAALAIGLAPRRRPSSPGAAPRSSTARIGEPDR